VRVNGAVVDEPGRRVEPDHDRITVRGRPLPGRSALRYLMLHKPVGVLTTLSDPEGRYTVREFLPPGPRLFPVGRLDADTSGLLLLTNDGELAHRLMHPRYGVRKVYRARLDRLPTPDQMRRLREGVEYERGVRSGPAEVRLVNARPDRPMVAIEVHEGRYRQVRRMCEAVGLEVKALHRSAYGSLRLGTLERGQVRDLTQVEVQRLKRDSARPVERLSPGGRLRPGAEPMRRKSAAPRLRRGRPAATPVPRRGRSRPGQGPRRDGAGRPSAKLRSGRRPPGGGRRARDRRRPRPRGSPSIS
jgi:23S rRNA pseudouridine2605 synthase